MFKFYFFTSTRKKYGFYRSFVETYLGQNVNTITLCCPISTSLNQQDKGEFIK